MAIGKITFWAVIDMIRLTISKGDQFTQGSIPVLISFRTTN